MAQLSEIPGIDASSVELLDMAGIRDAKHLSSQDPVELIKAITKANEVLSIVSQIPDHKQAEIWIQTAGELIGQSKKKKKIKQPVVTPPVNHEGSDQVSEMLASAPCAIPLPGKLLMEKQLRVIDIPAGLLLNRYSGDLDVRVEIPEIPEILRKEIPERRSTNPEHLGSKSQPLDFNPLQVKSFEPNPSTKQRIAKSIADNEEDRVALIRAPREATNRGKDPNSRRFIRGVLHTHPLGLRIGALFTLLLVIILPTAIISAFLLLFSRQNPESFDWVPAWLLVFPIALPIIGIGYMIWGFGGKCRICSQKLFVHKSALKHIKAHRLPGMGFAVPLSLHLLTFSWFRCSSCGTPVRLKK